MPLSFTHHTFDHHRLPQCGKGICCRPCHTTRPTLLACSVSHNTHSNMWTTPCTCRTKSRPMAVAAQIEKLRTAGMGLRAPRAKARTCAAWRSATRRLLMQWATGRHGTAQHSLRAAVAQCKAQGSVKWEARAAWQCEAQHGQSDLTECTALGLGAYACERRRPHKAMPT